VGNWGQVTDAMLGLALLEYGRASRQVRGPLAATPTWHAACLNQAVPKRVSRSTPGWARWAAGPRAPVTRNAGTSLPRAFRGNNPLATRPIPHRRMPPATRFQRNWRDGVAGASPHWRRAHVASGARRFRGATPPAARPLSCQAPRRHRGTAPLAIRSPSRAGACRPRGAAPMAVRPPLRTRRAPIPGYRPTGDTPSVTTGATASRRRRPTSSRPLRARRAPTPGRRPTGGTPSVMPGSATPRGAAPRRYALRSAPCARRSRGAAPLAIRPPLAPGARRSRAFAALATRPLRRAPALADDGTSRHWRHALQHGGHPSRPRGDAS